MLRFAECVSVCEFIRLFSKLHEKLNCFFVSLIVSACKTEIQRVFEATVVFLLFSLFLLIFFCVENFDFTIFLFFVILTNEIESNFK